MKCFHGPGAPPAGCLVLAGWRAHADSSTAPAAAEPFLPAEGTDVLEGLAFDLAREASELSGQLHPVVRL
jgi:hypothetical protein